MIKAFFKRKISANANVEKDKMDILYDVNGLKIWLPFDHKLPEYQAKFKNYDRKLRNVIFGITQFSAVEHTVGNIIIDIGANIGDSAALIRSCTDSHIVCIEGDPFFLKYLMKNTPLITGITIVDSFIKGRTDTIYGIIERKESTSCIKCSEDDNPLTSKIVAKSFQEITQEHSIDLSLVKLIKIDTDGFDFDIILSNKEVIDKYKPNLYFEYDITFNKDDMSDSLETITFLSSLGYGFIVYDNFGNLMESITDNYATRFDQINHYLKSCNDFGGGIYYIDVFATTSIGVHSIVLKSDNQLFHY